MPTTIVVGAGWAGLSCAYELAKANHKVLIIEAAPQIGGRARSIKFGDYIVDNGQHIGLGAYHTLRSILAELGLDENQLFKILPMEIFNLSKQALHLKLPALPKPYNLIVGVLTAHNLPWHAKLEILKFAIHLNRIKFKLPVDCTVLQLLQNYHQSVYVIEHIWEPIALAAMTTAIDKASAQIFCNILAQVFCTNPSFSNWYLPAVDLSNLLPVYLTEYLNQRGNDIIFNQSIKKIQINADDTVNVWSNSLSWNANRIVLATSPWQTMKLLHEHPELEKCVQDLQQFNYEPITNIYFQYSQPVRLPYPMLGILNASCHWIFDRVFVSQPNILCAVITGTTSMEFCTQELLSKQVLQDICKHFPHLASPIATKVICEKRAAFTCDVTIQRFRPQARTALKNLFLCGDYLQTGLPATLEGALLSGIQTALEILSD